MKNLLSIIEWIFKIGIAGILLQSLYFKFTGHEISQELFTKLGVEPWGRIGTGIIELIASILLFIPNRQWLGALLSLGAMTGAILAHIFKLGIGYPDGVLFWLAVAVFVMSFFVLWRNKDNNLLI